MEISSSGKRPSAQSKYRANEKDFSLGWQKILIGHMSKRSVAP